MSKILILAELDEAGVVQKPTLELLARANAAELSSTIAVLNTVSTELHQDLSNNGAKSICALDDVSATACARYTVKQQAGLLKEILSKAGSTSAWFSNSLRARDLAPYLATLIEGISQGLVTDLTVDGSSWKLETEIYAGRFVRTDVLDSSKPSCLSFAAGCDVPDPAEDAALCVLETIAIQAETTVTFDGDLVPGEKEEGIPLPEADVVIDIGDGVGTKGAAAAKKLNQLLQVAGVRSSVGATRVVTDGGRLPRNAQLGVSGISISPALIVCFGASGSPQHWSGIKNSAQIISINTDDEAPIQSLADLPVNGDGNAFLKDLTEVVSAELTDEQKEQLKKAKTTRPKTDGNGAVAAMSTAAMEHLPDTPLNIDKRSICFDAFEVFKAHEMFSQWNREKLESLLQKVIKFSENSLNQGKRDAEQMHMRFLPGEENEQQAVIAPEACKKGWKEYYKSGFGRLTVPRKFGGLEVPHTFFDIVSEVINAGSSSMGTAYELTQGASLILQNFGNDWMKEKIIPGLYDGRFQGTMCLTEAQAGSDLGAVAATAEQIEGTDEFQVSGTKVFITSGDHDMSENLVHIVLAKLKGTPHKGTRAISLFLVPKFWIDEDGDSGEFNDVITQSIEHKHGMTTSSTAVLKFNNSRGILIGTSLDDELRQPSGMKQMFFMMNYMRHETGTAARGQAMASCLDAIVYSMEREQGVSMSDRAKGERKSPIFNHPSQRNALLDMFSRTLGGRCMTLKLTEIRDRADVDFEEGMHAFKEGLGKLDVNPADKKKIDELMAQLGKIKRQFFKAKLGKKALAKDPEKVAEIEKDLRDLAKQQKQVRKEIKRLSKEFLKLQDTKAKVVAAKKDSDAYALIFTSLVKAQVTDDNICSLNEAMNALGGLGFMAEAPVSQRLKDSQVLCIWEGTNDIQALNTVGRQISPANKLSSGQSVFDAVMDEMGSFLLRNKNHATLGACARYLKTYADELLRFRNLITLATPKDIKQFNKFSYGSGRATTDKKVAGVANLKWAEMIQASSRSFSTWFSQAIEAWQLLRSAVVAANFLGELKTKGAGNTTFDSQLFDERFLQGRELLANHFITSPNGLDKGLFQWELSFYDTTSVTLEYGHLADAVDTISQG